MENKINIVNLSDKTKASDLKEEQVFGNDPQPESPTMHQMNTSSVRTTYSYFLPNEEENIISALVLSKWDDIMGPQTVHVWFKRKSQESLDGSLKSFDDLDIPTIIAKTEEEKYLVKSINYLSTHTVNYSGVNMTSSKKELSSFKNSTFFVVPDLNFVSQALIFYLKKDEFDIPYSFAILVHYKYNSYYLSYFDLVRIWLEKLSSRVRNLKDVSFKNIEQDDEMHDNILHLCQTIISINMSPLNSFTISNQQEFLKHPLLEKALTSHLQTSGCSVIIGVNCHEINSMIEFLALFLTKEEKLCSKLIQENESYSFQNGLYLQGLLLDEFGFRAIKSEDLETNPYPVTTIELINANNKTGSVKQTILYHLMKNILIFQKSTKKNKDQSLLCPIKDSSVLVKNFLQDLTNLPLEKWPGMIHIFQKKIYFLSKTLINLVDLFNSNCRIDESLHTHICRLLELTEEDLLVVLATAEKKQPGISSFILQTYFAR